MRALSGVCAPSTLHPCAGKKTLAAVSTTWKWRALPRPPASTSPDPTSARLARSRRSSRRPHSFCRSRGFLGSSSSAPQFVICRVSGQSQGRAHRHSVPHEKASKWSETRHSTPLASALAWIAFARRCARAVVETLRVGELIRATPRIAAMSPMATGRLSVSPSKTSPRTTPTPARK
jgi:hypothetical protein